MKQRTKDYTKINVIKSWFFLKINKIEKSMTRLTKEKKRENTHISKIRIEKRDVIKDTTEIKRIILEYYGRLYVTKFNNLEKSG